MNPAKPFRLRLFLWLLLFVAAVIAYFYLQPPLQNAFRRLLPFIAGLLYAACAAGLGFPLAVRVLPRQSAMEQALAAAAFGIGLTGLLVFITGLFGIPPMLVFAAWILLGAALLLLHLFRVRANAAAPQPGAAIWTAVSLAVLAVFCCVNLPFFLSPEVSSDAMAYHLLIPKIYLNSGRIGYIPHLVQSNYPMLTELNYLVLLGLFDPAACKGFHFACGILCLVTIAGIVRKADPEISGLPACALFASMPVVVLLSGWAWNDLLFTFLVLLAVLFLLNYHVNPENDAARNILTAGIAAGLAAWTKYTSVVYLSALLLTWFWGARKWNWDLRKMIWFVAPVAAISAPWIIKNWVFTGNPVYPFLNGLFGSPEWTETSARYLDWAQRQYEIPNWTFLTYLQVPYLVTVKPSTIDIHPGVLPLALAPLAFVKAGSRGMSLLKAFLVASLLVWLPLHPRMRTLLPLLAIFFCVVSVPLQQLTAQRTVRRAVIGLLVVAWLSNLWIAAVNTYYLFDPVRWLFGLETTAHYRERVSPSSAAYSLLNADPGVEAVLLVSQHDPLYLNPTAYFSSSLDTPFVQMIVGRVASVDQLALVLKEMKITHIVFNQDNYRNQQSILYTWPAEKKKLFETFLQEHCRQVRQFANIQVLEVH